MNYEYADGDLLSSPQKYQYTQYGGAEFIDAWKLQRKMLCASLPEPVLPESKNVAEKGPTYQQLIEICSQLRQSVFSDENRSKLLFYLKKFEVSKRIYSEYSPEGKAGRGDYVRLMNYLLLAECSIYQWQQERCSYWLNLLLKINDTLSTQTARMSLEEQAYLHWVLLAEAEQIGQLEIGMK